MITKENNLVRLVYIIVAKLDFSYTEKIGILSKNDIPEKIEYLSQLLNNSSLATLKSNMRSIKIPPLAKKYSQEIQKQNSQINSDKNQKIGIFDFSFDLSQIQDINKITKVINENTTLDAKVRKTIIDELNRLRRTLGSVVPFN